MTIIVATLVREDGSSHAVEWGHWPGRLTGARARELFELAMTPQTRAYYRFARAEFVRAWEAKKGELPGPRRRR